MAARGGKTAKKMGKFIQTTFRGDCPFRYALFRGAEPIVDLCCMHGGAGFKNHLQSEMLPRLDCTSLMGARDDVLLDGFQAKRVQRVAGGMDIVHIIETTAVRLSRRQTLNGYWMYSVHFPAPVRVFLEEMEGSAT